MTIWKDRYDLFHLIFETNLQYPVRFVYHKRLQVPEHKSLGFLNFRKC
jgi:hypothetical protein